MNTVYLKQVKNLLKIISSFFTTLATRERIKKKQGSANPAQGQYLNPWRTLDQG